MPHRKLRWKAITALVATASLVCAASVLLRNDAPAVYPTGSSASLPPLILPEPRIERNAPAGQVDTVVLRAAPHLAGNVAPTAVVERLIRQGVRRVWLQCKQDESDEFVSGETFYPSRIAPVAPGFEDGRFWRFVDMLREARIEVAAWVPAFNDARAAEQNPDWRAHRLSEGGSPEPQPDWL